MPDDVVERLLGGPEEHQRRRLGEHGKRRGLRDVDRQTRLLGDKARMGRENRREGPVRERQGPQIARDLAGIGEAVHERCQKLSHAS